ncbi:hypothetical protein [Actinoplanes siamensis]
MTEPPRSGDVLFVGREASVQFAGERALYLRVIRVLPHDTYQGWIWLDGYTVSTDGEAVERRTIFVQLAGLRTVAPAPTPAPAPRRGDNRGPAGRQWAGRLQPAMMARRNR